MLTLVKHLNKDVYLPRTYVVASTDSMGAQKAQTAEQELAGHQVPYYGDAAVSIQEALPSLSDKALQQHLAIRLFFVDLMGAALASALGPLPSCSECAQAMGCSDEQAWPCVLLHLSLSSQ